MPRSLVVLFLTVFVSLIGFGIIIPLLPFYAQTFGASPTTIGLLQVRAVASPERRLYALVALPFC